MIDKLCGGMCPGVCPCPTDGGPPVSQFAQVIAECVGAVVTIAVVCYLAYRAYRAYWAFRGRV